jgi:hypothetical protein
MKKCWICNRRYRGGNARFAREEVISASKAGCAGTMTVSTVTHLPAALPLFATDLGGLGLLG